MATICSRDSKRAFDSQSNVGDHVGLDLKLAIAEQLEEHCLGQFDIRRGEPRDRRQSESRQQVRCFEPPGVRRRAATSKAAIRRSGEPCSLGEKRALPIARRGRRPRSARHAALERRPRRSRSFSASPRSVMAPAAPAQIVPRWLFPAPSGPTMTNIRPAQFGQSSIAFSASRLDGAGEKIFARETWRMRPAKCQLARRRNHRLSGSERPR